MKKIQKLFPQVPNASAYSSNFSLWIQRLILMVMVGCLPCFGLAQSAATQSDLVSPAIEQVENFRIVSDEFVGNLRHILVEVTMPAAATQQSNVLTFEFDKPFNKGVEIIVGTRAGQYRHITTKDDSDLPFGQIQVTLPLTNSDPIEYIQIVFPTSLMGDDDCCGGNGSITSTTIDPFYGDPGDGSEKTSIQASIALLEVGPNPATEYVNLRNGTEGELLVGLRNSLGQRLQEIQVASLASCRLNVAGLPRGIYYICANGSKPILIVLQ